SASGTPAGVTFSYVYDGTAGVNPQIAVRVTNNNPATSADDIPFDLELVSNSSREFDLARLDAVGTSGIRNVVVQGNVLPAITSGMASYLTLPNSATGGVRLPADNINGVFAADNITVGSVLAKSVEAVAFGSVTVGSVRIKAEAAGDDTATKVLAYGTRLAQASGLYIVPFSESQKVAWFASLGCNDNEFSDKSVLLSDQTVDGQSITATLTVGGTSGSGRNQSSTVQSIRFDGTGAAIVTGLPIQSAISSNGALGDLILSSSSGLTANVSALSIMGNIDVSCGPITGTIETLAGDIGRALVSSKGQIQGVTSIHSGGALTGRIISRGNLISSIVIDGGATGVVAAQGDLGVVQTDVNGNAVVQTDAGRSLVRFGGLRVNGGLSGQVVTLGNVFGDLTINGGLSGQIAAKGRAVAGLHVQRIGILGNITINGGIASTGSIVSVGVIGDNGVYSGAGSNTYGTHLVINGNSSGILAAEGNINFGKTGKLNTAVFANATGENKAAIDAIFTQQGVPLTFDTIVNGKSGLTWILGDMLSLRVGANGKLTGPVP
ncbi:MAG: hypothetical protein JSS02_33060, partial [Planctomycetes bacterium]|nr:hypothetical protein [Planctomycetota bacterium]